MIDERILGAIRFLDSVTRLPVDAPLVVRALGLRATGASAASTVTDVQVRWTRTQRGLFAIRSVPGLDGMDPAARGTTPGSLELDLAIYDPSGHYLARRRTVHLPRDPDPARAAEDPPALPSDLDPAQEATPGPLFQPIDVLLFPSTAIQVSAAWAALRATITGATADDRLAGALVRVQRTDTGAHLGNALADDRGEALVAVTGIPATTFNGGHGAVMSPGADVELDVVYDPSASAPPDPFDLEQRRTDLLVRTVPLRLVAGRVLEQAL